MFRRKKTDAFGREVVSSTGSVGASPGTYHEEGWFYDLTQVRGAAIALAVAVAGFVATYAVSSSHHGSGGSAQCYRGACANGLDTLGFLLSVATVVGSLVTLFVGISSALDAGHRVRKLAWSFAALGGVNLVGFTVFIIVLST